MAQEEADATRLERLWGGEFGDQYVDRNTEFGVRENFWSSMFGTHATEVGRVLEVGCNLGGNLQWVTKHVEPHEVYGVDINHKALTRLRAEVPGVNALWSPARELPFRDKWFDLVFTMGVLIHQPDDTLPLVMAEMVRTSRRFVLCGEYFAESEEEVPYRGETGALFRRDYGGLFLRLFPELELRASGFLGKDEGWDDVTWWLFDRP